MRGRAQGGVSRSVGGGESCGGGAEARDGGRGGGGEQQHTVPPAPPATIKRSACVIAVGKRDRGNSPDSAGHSEDQSAAKPRAGRKEGGEESKEGVAKALEVQEKGAGGSRTHDASSQRQRGGKARVGEGYMTLPEALQVGRLIPILEDDEESNGNKDADNRGLLSEGSCINEEII